MSVQQEARPAKRPAPHQIQVVVYGTPVPQGSKDLVRNRMIDHNAAQLHRWRQSVVTAAVLALDEHPMWNREYPAIVAHFAFTLGRPAYHYLPPSRLKKRPERVVRDTAPRLHASKPDLDKLVRSTCDALTMARIYPDDCRVAQLHAIKVYPDVAGTGALDRPGVRIVLTGVNQ